MKNDEIIVHADESSMYNTLEKYLKKRKESNRKLMEYVEEYKEYINNPNNTEELTFKEWVEKK